MNINLKLRYNGYAHFVLEEKYGNFLEKMTEHNAEAMECVCTAAELLAEQAQSYRVLLGMERQPVPSALELMVRLKPVEVIKLKTAILEAYQKGMDSGISDEDTEVDLVLEEINSKKKEASG